MHFKASGTAFLCFAGDDSVFQGIFKAESGETYSLAGTPGKLPSKSFHECCFDTIPTFYTIEIAMSKEGELASKYYSFEHVMRTGGDNCRLSLDDSLEFNTDRLLAGSKAEDFISKYFPDRFLNKSCYVCVGEMMIDHVFPEENKLEDL